MRQYLISRIRSFGYAFQGIAMLIRTQANVKIHLLAIIVIVLIGLWLGLSITEWCFITVCIGMVLMAEAFNTALEFLVDLVSPDHHPLAGKIKDLAAAAVLLSVIFCGIVWGIINIPKIMALLTLPS